MEINESRARSQHRHAADVLRRLDAIGAINLDVLVAKSGEIQAIAGLSELEPEDNMCFPFFMHIGPRLDFDLVSVANQVRQLGFDLTRKSGGL